MKATDYAIEQELIAFESGGLDPANFPHREHVRLAFELLARHSFGEAVTRFSSGLKRLVAKVDQPQKYHETITVAFLAIIGERRAAQGICSWVEFARRNPDMLDKSVIERWYDRSQIETDLARTTFCLPWRR
jgi:hypothetical protein